MRPLVLTMQAFGPYKTSETLDFADLGSNRSCSDPRRDRRRQDEHPRRDGLCPVRRHERGERQGVQMHAAGQPDPEAADRGRLRLRARRPRLPRETPPQAGTGSVARFGLRHEADGGRPLGTGRRVGGRGHGGGRGRSGDEGKPLATLIREVDAQVGAARLLLGQFRQVVVLPQGKFRDLLSAGSDGAGRSAAALPAPRSAPRSSARSRTARARPCARSS